MTRFLNHVVVWALVTLALALSAYVTIVGAPKAAPTGSRVAVAGTPHQPAHARGVGAPRRVDAVQLEQRPAHHHRYRIDWRRRYLAEHRHVQRLLHQLARHVQAHETPQATIRRVFGTHGDEAVRVAYCETGGTFSPAATNGQYRGIFQMGSRERATYGDAGDVEGQARAAYRYFSDAGWAPWECKP